MQSPRPPRTDSDDPRRPNRIRELREHYGLLPRQLAERVGATTTDLERWEDGHEPPDAMKAALADALRVSVPFLMGWVDGGGNGGDDDANGDTHSERKSA